MYVVLNLREEESPDSELMYCEISYGDLITDSESISFFTNYLRKKEWGTPAEDIRPLSVFTVGLDVKEIVIRHAVNAKSGFTDSSKKYYKFPHTSSSNTFFLLLEDDDEENV